MWPTTRAYTDFLVRTAADGDMSKLLAALLPCAWGYAYIGRQLVAGERSPDARYADALGQPVELAPQPVGDRGELRGGVLGDPNDEPLLGHVEEEHAGSRRLGIDQAGVHLLDGLKRWSRNSSKVRNCDPRVIASFTTAVAPSMRLGTACCENRQHQSGSLS
jgi:hypothetical protein